MTFEALPTAEAQPPLHVLDARAGAAIIEEPEVMFPSPPTARPEA